MSIPNHVIEQLNSRADLVGIIGKHTTLKKAGREFKGCCPFHGEKTPSFYVNPQKNVYNCFGCGVGGNAISFLRDYENLTFMEAVQELSRQTGIEIPEDDTRNLSYAKRVSTPAVAPSAGTSRQLTPKQNPAHPPLQPQNGTDSTTDNAATSVHNAPAITDENSEDSYYADVAAALSATDEDAGYGNSNGYDDSFIHTAQNANTNKNAGTNAGTNTASQNPQTEGNLYDLLAAVANYYRQQLFTHAQALGYFKQRGLSDDTIATFMLGYAPAGWQHLEQAFAQDIEGLKILGLVRTSEKGRDYDLLRDRVIFPIKDNQGRIIGFAGRALDNEVKPKYINSSDSPVFHKQHVLYGYYESRQHRANDWLVVEGYMDVIALYQAGIYGAVASMGTALAESQISRLLQMNPTLTLCFDGDAAGHKAAWRAVQTSLPVLGDDKELRLLSLPDGHDPDTFVAAHGVDAMRQQIAHAQPLSHYVYEFLSQQYKVDTAEGKAKVMAQVRQLTSQLPKGSSFRYLLNNDIYSKLGGKSAKKNKAQHQDATLDFIGWLTTSRQLELCLLYHPQFLKTDPIHKIYQAAGIANPDRTLNRSLHTNLDNSLPALPTWQDFADDSLMHMIEVIQKLMPQLITATPNVSDVELVDTHSLQTAQTNIEATSNPINTITNTTANNTANTTTSDTHADPTQTDVAHTKSADVKRADANTINATAHFVIASLPVHLQQSLSPHWQSFWANLQQRGVTSVDNLATDLLTRLILDVLRRQISEAKGKGILVISTLNKRQQKLSDWHKQWQASL